MIDNEKTIQSLRAEIYNLSQSISNFHKSIGAWMPRKEAMRFLDYGDTAMAALEQSGEIIVSKVGRRKFINTESLIAYLNRQVIK